MKNIFSIIWSMGRKYSWLKVEKFRYPTHIFFQNIFLVSECRRRKAFLGRKHAWWGGSTYRWLLDF